MTKGKAAKTIKKNTPLNHADEQLRTFANLIVDRLIEDKNKGKLQLRSTSD